MLSAVLEICIVDKDKILQVTCPFIKLESVRKANKILNFDFPKEEEIQFSITIGYFL